MTDCFVPVFISCTLWVLKPKRSSCICSLSIKSTKQVHGNDVFVCRLYAQRSKAAKQSLQRAAVRSVCLSRESPHYLTFYHIADNKTKLHFKRNRWESSWWPCFCRNEQFRFFFAQKRPLERNTESWFIAHNELLSSCCCNGLMLTCSRNVKLLQTFHTVTHTQNRGTMSLWYFRKAQVLCCSCQIKGVW